MSVNPQIIKQLLQAQLLSPLDFIASGGKPVITDHSSEDFAFLLEQAIRLAGSRQDTAANAEPAVSAPGTFRFAQPFPVSKPSQFDVLIERASAKYGVDSSLIKAVIQSESSFNPYAVSHAGAKGLMQLMDATGQALGVTDPFDPEQNINAGTKYLAYLLDKYNGNEAVALAAYNAGPGRIDRLGIAGDADLRDKYDELPEETRRYVDKVLEARSHYSG